MGLLNVLDQPYRQTADILVQFNRDGAASFTVSRSLTNY